MLWMLDGGLDPMYRQALAGPHELYTLAEVLDGLGNVLEGDLVYENGSVSATLTSRVARTLQLSVAEDLYPFEPGDLLAPYGNYLRVWRGVRFATGEYRRWVIFYGRIRTPKMADNGVCNISAMDRAANVIEARFTRPQNSQPGNPVPDEVRRLISDGVPDAVFGDFNVKPIPTRPVTWQLDRAQALDELATSVSAFWYPLADGTYVMRQYPWTVVAEPVVTYSDSATSGDDPYGGTVSNSYPGRTRETVSNSLTVTGELLNGQGVPVYATAQDDDPASPTYVGGTFGVKHQLLRLQTPSTQEAIQAAARNNLRRLVALNDNWDWVMVPDAALELGDVVRLRVRGRTVIQVVAGFVIPLGDGAMSVNARELVSGQLEGVE